MDDLKNMYGLYALVDALPKLRQAFSAYIKRVGTAMVSDEATDPGYVSRRRALRRAIRIRERGHCHKPRKVGR